jgi:uncharacterized membrane protein YkoI
MVGFLGGVPAAQADNDHDRALGLRHKGEILPLTTIIQRTSRRFPGEVLEVELKKKDGRRVYEIEILGDDHVVREILVDAANGKILSVEKD